MGEQPPTQPPPAGEHPDEASGAHPGGVGDELIAQLGVERVRELVEAWAPVARDVLAAWEQFADAVGGVEGLKALVAAKEEWEAAHPGLRWGEPCMCMCSWNGHDGAVCEGYASVRIPFRFDGERHHHHWCQPCADNFHHPMSRRRR